MVIPNKCDTLILLMEFPKTIKRVGKTKQAML